MVYKKYIKRNGKVFGPYYYESYRENGKVKTRFVSGPKESHKKKSKKSYFFAFSVFILILLFFIWAFDSRGVIFTGNVIGYGTAECFDGNDNDGDNLVDSQDPGCWNFPSDPWTYNPYLDDESIATSECQDGIDNDGDNLIDSLDSECWININDSQTYHLFDNSELEAKIQIDYLETAAVTIEKHKTKKEIVCSEWNKCKVNYNVAFLGDDGFYFEGSQERICNNLIDVRKCVLKKPVNFKKVDDEVEVYDEEGELISKMKVETKDNIRRLDIEIVV
jgi:hypothetical protein